MVGLGSDRPPSVATIAWLLISVAVSSSYNGMADPELGDRRASR